MYTQFITTNQSFMNEKLVKWQIARELDLLFNFQYLQSLIVMIDLNCFLSFQTLILYSCALDQNFIFAFLAGDNITMVSLIIFDIYQQQLQHQFIILLYSTIMAMDPRNTKYSRSIFYRGISLKDYLRKSSAVHPNLQYPDDETILVDENKTPVKIDNSFIHTEPSDPTYAQAAQESRSVTKNHLPAQKSNIELPTLKSKSKLKIYTHTNITDRNSTDTSIGSSFDLKIPQLPQLQKKELSYQENRLISSRSESRSVSRRRNAVQAVRDLEQVQEEAFVRRQKQHLTREYTQYIKKEMMMKHRYNVQGQVKAPNSKIRYFNRVKSNAE